MDWEKTSEDVKARSSRVSKTFQIDGTNPRLAFNICYWAANSIRSKCVHLSETESPYSGEATLFRSTDDDKVVVSVSVKEKGKAINVEVWCTNSERLETIFDDVMGLIEKSLSKAKDLSYEEQDHILRLIDVEKELDVSLKSTLVGGNVRSIYFSLADSRETLYKLLGPDRFDPILLSMGQLLETLHAYDNKHAFKKEDQEKTALSVLKWKKRVDEMIKQDLFS
ncbi:MAG: hypothetical protein ACFFC5_06685 [Promethearchaeota archaeon]